MWVRSRAQTRSLARGALRRELADKGIAGDTAEEALDQLTDQDEQESAAALVRRKLRPGMGLDDRPERDKQVRRLVAMLARKGYPPGMAFRLVDQEIDRYLAGTDS